MDGMEWAVYVIERTNERQLSLLSFKGVHLNILPAGESSQLSRFGSQLIESDLDLLLAEIRYSQPLSFDKCFVILFQNKIKVTCADVGDWLTVPVWA